jgi:hypothetical protein
MSILTTKDINTLIDQCELFSHECPEFPAAHVKEIIIYLFAEYNTLISGKGKAAKKNLSMPQERPRRPLKKFPYHTPAHVRILANVIKDKKTGCWIWPGSGHRYGTIGMADGTQVGVHRAMFEYANKRRLKPNEVVRHSCDNGFCCNPKHLTAGTQRDNAHDRVSRHRSGFQKLSYETAKKILIRFRKGETALKLSREFGVSQGAISKIGKDSFKRLMVDPDVKKQPFKVGQLRRAKLTIADVRLIRERLKKGELQKDIAKDFGVDDTVISGINRGRMWNGVK